MRIEERLGPLAQARQFVALEQFQHASSTRTLNSDTIKTARRHSRRNTRLKPDDSRSELFRDAC